MKKISKSLVGSIIAWVLVSVLMFVTHGPAPSFCLYLLGSAFLFVPLVGTILGNIEKDAEKKRKDDEKLEEEAERQIERQQARQQFETYKSEKKGLVDIKMLQTFFKGGLSQEEKYLVLLNFDLKKLVDISDLKKQIVWDEGVLRYGLSELEQAMKSSYDDEFIQGIVDNFVDFLNKEIKNRKGYLGIQAFLNKLEAYCPTVIRIMKGES